MSMPFGSAPDPRPSLAVWKFASCDGCQLSVLDCEDELLALADAVHIAYFPEATRAVGGRAVRPLPGRGLDHDRRGRRADPGGPAGLQDADHDRGLRDRGRDPGAAQLRRRRAVHRSIVYANPSYISTLERSTPIADHVRVDFELRGCPIDRYQLLEVLTAFLQDRRPRLDTDSVCVTCKRRGIVCVTVAHGTPCLGPVTHGGCGALCPAFDRGCYGCFGPVAGANTDSLASRLVDVGMPRRDVVRLFRTFNAGAEAFRAESTRQEQDEAASTVNVRRSGDDPSDVRRRAGAHRRDPGPGRGRGRHARACARRGGHRRPAADLRAAAVLRGVPARAGLHRATRHHRADLRDLPGRLPDVGACNAIEQACGVVVPEEIRLLRRLLYCGEWIESHALHVYLLHAPDFLGYPGAIEMAATTATWSSRGCG